MKLSGNLSIFVYLIALIVLLSACASDSSEMDYPIATSATDISGKWMAAEDRFHYYSEEGTHYYSHSLEQLEDRVDNNKAPEGEFWFDGNLHYHTSTACTLKGIEDPGIFEVFLIDEQTIKFVVDEDECNSRIDWLAGPESEREEYVWTRVP